MASKVGFCRFLLSKFVENRATFDKLEQKAQVISKMYGKNEISIYANLTTSTLSEMTVLCFVTSFLNVNTRHFVGQTHSIPKGQANSIYFFHIFVVKGEFQEYVIRCHQ
jgi:hypothetical protein